MWEFYLAASEMAFRHQGLMVFQIQLARRQEAVPLTRDYIAAAEDRLRAAERRAATPLRLAESEPHPRAARSAAAAATGPSTSANRARPSSTWKGVPKGTGPVTAAEVPRLRRSARGWPAAAPARR